MDIPINNKIEHAATTVLAYNLDMDSVGDRIRLALDRKGYTISALAAAIHKPQSFVSAVINGKRPGRSILPAIAAALDVKIEWLTIGDRLSEPPWVTENRLLQQAQRLGEEGIQYMDRDQAAAVTALVANLEQELARARRRAEIAEQNERDLQQEVDLLRNRLTRLTLGGEEK